MVLVGAKISGGTGQGQDSRQGLRAWTQCKQAVWQAGDAKRESSFADGRFPHLGSSLVIAYFWTTVSEQFKG